MTNDKNSHCVKAWSRRGARRNCASFETTWVVPPLSGAWYEFLLVPFECLNAGQFDGASLKNHVNYTPGRVLCIQESTHLRTSPHCLLPSLILQLLLAMVSLRWRDTISFHRYQNDTTDYFGTRQLRRCHCCLPACKRSGLDQIMQINNTAELRVQLHGTSDIDLGYYENPVNTLTRFLTSQRFPPRYLCLASRDG